MKDSYQYIGPLCMILRDIVHRSYDSPAERIFHGRKIIYTHKGRGALGKLCRHWKLNVGQEILMPAYNCGTEIDPFIFYDLKVIFYRITKQALIDLEDLLHRVTSRTQVIYVTHYFGWPHNIQSLYKYCRDKNIHLIEDCALSLFSNPVQLPIGLLGDAAIYSLPKTLPVPDGGVLTMAEKSCFAEELCDAPSAIIIFKELLPLIKRAVLRFINNTGYIRYVPTRFIQSKAQRDAFSETPAGLPEMPQSYYFDKTLESKTISGITRHILKHTSPEYIVKQRRINYMHLLNATKGSKILTPLFHYLPEGVCPLFFPVIVKDREAVYRQFTAQGIAVTRWWSGYHRAFDWREFSEAKYLKDHLLTIPVHQQLSSDEVEYICSIISSID